MLWLQRHSWLRRQVLNPFLLNLSSKSNNIFISSSIINILNPCGLRVIKTHPQYNYTYYVKEGGFVHTNFAKRILMKFSEDNSKWCMKYIILRNNDEFIERSYDLPEIQNSTIMCKPPDYYNVICGIVNTDIWKCICTCDIEGAIKKMDCEVTDNIVDAVTNKYKIDLSNLELEISAKEQMIYSSSSIRDKELEPFLQKRNVIKNKINNIEERIKNTEMCNICYNTIDNKTLLECCSNSFCYECIATWINQNLKEHKICTCPMCKNAIIKENMIIENKTIKNKIEKNRNLIDKPQQIIKILSEKDPKKSKILIFSENDISFDIIVKSIDNKKWKWNRIKGNTNVINSIVEKYKNTDELNILFINAKCFGSGLNLENTTDIIMYHKLDKDLENQVIGRGQRIGRTCPLNVLTLSYPNE